MRDLLIRLIGVVAICGSAFGMAIAQSSSQDYPTPIVSNELSGTIKARDIGDARLTTYYFAFNGEQGDVFINLVTRNLTGDFDVFAASGLKPLTKIVVYADLSENETGRVIYLRKPERLLLRIQGRTPNDDPASFRLKFAGSFAALRPDDVPTAPDVPKVESQGAARVNSVGTLLPPPPKSVEPVVEKEKTEIEAEKTETVAEQKPAETDKTPAPEEKPERETKVIVTDPLASTPRAEFPPRRTTSSRPRAAARRTQPKVEAQVASSDDQKDKTSETKSSEEKPVDAKATDEVVANDDTPVEDKVVEKVTSATDEKVAEDKPADNISAAADEKSAAEKDAASPGFRTLTGKKRPSTLKKPVEPAPDPLASINLVIQFKDGNLIEKPMSEVFKFSVDKGILTVALKNGSTSRYKIVDVEKVTIQ